MSKFKTELESLINRYSMENGSNTPDYILAQYLCDCLDLFGKIVKQRDDHWEGKNPSHCFKETRNV